MITRQQVKMARAALGWGVRELAEKAGVTANTVSRFENGADAYGETLGRIQRALETAGIVFIPEGQPSPDGGAGVRLKAGA
ncbi:helix-turn-helix domain-containing protein [Caenispirillum bisanense]|uniref:Helix-turn-helix domain-containing protein n=1 Tax=Caenispirillum bisanense TaxID=414052 RepID=A0A286H2D8_9PROT|nr:helix-turn-helix transcriptional regulator [Caenispirillum bisanense]SOE01911.1 Helix-turn-helix domain-containing protein [Caenispirillum bisanense]